MRLSFGASVVDTDRRVLERGGRPVHLSPKALALLELLVAQSPRAVSKQELLDQIWPDVIVEEENVKSLIFEIRQALGEDAAVIRTVHRFGYAFAGELLETTTTARLVGTDRTYSLRRGQNSIGRAPFSDISLGGTGVSRRHALIIVAADSASLEDLGSKNGTWRNGQRITGPVELRDRDTIRIGLTTVTFVLTGPGSSTVTIP